MTILETGKKIMSLFGARATDASGTSTIAAPAEPSAAPPLPAGFTRMSEHSADDIFICGYPKSGNTWVQSMLVGVIYGVDLELAPDALVKDLMPDVHYRDFYKRYTSPVFFKSHALPQPDYKRVIYLLRDGRDVMVSYFHFLEALTKQKLDFLNIVQSGEHLFPARWHVHVQQWLANPHRSEMITVRYEDLQKDAMRELLRMCDFAGLKRDRTILEQAVRKASFSRMQNREDRLGWEGGNWPKDKHFVRRGVVGSYVDEMPPEVLEAFTCEAGPIMRQLGYLA